MGGKSVLVLDDDDKMLYTRVVIHEIWYISTNYSLTTIIVATTQLGHTQTSTDWRLCFFVYTLQKEDL